MEKWGSRQKLQFLKKCKLPHVTILFCQEYLEYENITTLRYGDFEEKYPSFLKHIHFNWGYF